MQTLYDIYLESITKFPKKRRFLYWKDGRCQTISTSDFHAQVEAVAYSLQQLRIKKGNKVAIIMYNRLEWAVCDYAIQMIGAINVPIYTTLPRNQSSYILKDSGAALVIAENQEIAGRTEHNKIITIEPVDGYMSYQELLHRGASRRVVPSKCNPEELATIIYTSGTTGEQKGVMLSHRNLVSNLLAACNAIGINPNDTIFSFLPLSHSFERIVDYAAFHAGSTIAYPENFECAIRNISQVKPTVMACVPRVLEKVYQAIEQHRQGLSGMKSGIFEWAVKIGDQISQYRLTGTRPPFWLGFKSTIADSMVFKKIRAKLGGRIRLILSGAAPLSKDIAQFLYSCGINILEGYGLTETSPVVCTNREGKIKWGTVGQPLEDVEVKLLEDGELIVRGPNIMKGYYNKPKETEAVLKNGWLHTGDVAEIDPDGFIKIIDRKKDLFKTSGGKYIAPQSIENMLKRSPVIQDAIVIGDGRKFPASLIVPNMAMIKGDPNEIIGKEVDKVNETLSQPEKIKKFALLNEGFTVESGLITPTMKARRREIEKKFKDLIEKLYSE